MDTKRLYSPKQVKEVLDRHGFYFSKSLGQNFLIDGNTVRKIVYLAGITKEDCVIEIGPGMGTLTEELAINAKKVISIELDSRLKPILEETLAPYGNTKIIFQDVLKVDLKELIKTECEGLNVKIVANLPYYVTTPIIAKLIESELPIESISVMVQKEVADRLIAKPGEKNSGAITYAISYFADAEKVLEVPNTSFMPAPEVNSSVIKLNILREPSVKVKSEKMLFNVIKLAFAQKRKTLLNALTNGKLANKEEVEKMLIDLNLDLKIRGEKLSLQDFARIADYMEEKR